MVTPLEATLGDRSHFNGRYSTSSSNTDIPTVYTSPAKARIRTPVTNDIEVRVGKPPHARFIQIPGSALKACPVLRARLVQGCRIMNTDAAVFEIILDYMGSSTLLRRLRPSAKTPLKQLTGSCDAMLKLAKAWHLADMLDDVRLQNKLVDTYRAFYLELLDAHAQIPLEHEPFRYLEDHIGTHTKIEKFMIDFFAGLTRHTGDFSAEELLPFRHDVAQSLKLRRAQLVVLRLSDDLIATGNACFNLFIIKARLLNIYIVILDMSFRNTKGSYLRQLAHMWPRTSNAPATSKEHGFDRKVRSHDVSHGHECVTAEFRRGSSTFSHTFGVSNDFTPQQGALHGAPT
ncbi:hypothetical protein J4E93_002697 [Alternaria ventricosa]|uniref:uncharacterized protein n=1 Tax=Alternaria ventricosa TaxID=1187951 RepID=UPI0020C56FF6|nr:uncharacterized protein J4E93_002697 [Alternaria ventricosa]KAI4650341.1 hypothetical protein J4E93_002697 [Alternaria ventricosa]